MEGEGNSYTTHFRQLDVRVARWLSIDPKSTPWESPYVSMGNNPVLNNDILGDTVARFNSDGNFKDFFDDGKTDWTWEIGSENSSGVWQSTTTGTFNDPSNIDVQAIKNGVITKIEILSDSKVDNMIDESGVRDQTGTYGDRTKFAWNEGSGKMDYAWNNARSGNLNKNTLYVRESVAYNLADIGNYLWGRGMAELGIMLGEAKLGAHVNNFLFT